VRQIGLRVAADDEASFVEARLSESDFRETMALFPSFSLRMNRCRQPELMDKPGLDLSEHLQALQGLRRINRVSRTGSVLWPAVARLARRKEVNGRPVRVLDLASGGGDNPIKLDRQARRAGLNLEVEGCDISPQAVDYAQKQARAHNANVRFFVLDAVHDTLPSGYDVLTCSLFLHHLDETDAIALLRQMGNAARRLVLVDDLVRSRWGYLMAVVGCHLLSSSRVVHVDGPISVAGAFTPGEALSLAEQAGLRGATLTRHWPQRYLLTWNR
jgi:2-polyprenyl-3-methyl-5-hydroxy-6-metoxy-1,4-benzoquinol methylase